LSGPALGVSSARHPRHRNPRPHVARTVSRSSAGRVALERDFSNGLQNGTITRRQQAQRHGMVSDAHRHCACPLRARSALGPAELAGLPARLIGRRSSRSLVWPADEAIVLWYCLAGATDRSVVKRDCASVSRIFPRTGVKRDRRGTMGTFIVSSGAGGASRKSHCAEQQDRNVRESHGAFLLG
jgi:hypothetical protein